MAQHTSGEDRFVATSMQLLAWAQRHTRALVLGLGAVAILVFGVRYYFDYQRQVRQAASTEMRALRAQLQTGSANQLADRISAYLIQYGTSPYAQEARVLLAETLLQANRASEAIEPARRATVDISKDVLSMRAAFLLAAAHEEVGDTASAISVYEQIGRSARSRVAKSRGLEGAARLQAARGRREDAARLYEELVELTPEDAAARAFYEMRVAELRAKPLGSAGAGDEAVLQTR